jgi:hypothetical protein
MTDITQTPLGKLVASEDNVLRTAATDAGVQNSRRQLPCTDCCNRWWSASTTRESSRSLMAGPCLNRHDPGLRNWQQTPTTTTNSFSLEMHAGL